MAHRRKQLQLFEIPSAPRAAPRKLMHVFDAGPGVDDTYSVRFRCSRCGHESDWQWIKVSEAKRGMPCPDCNKSGAST